MTQAPKSLEQRWFPLRRARPGARLRLFALPYAGGGASVFRAWPAALAPEIEVVAVQPPGREERLSEPPLRSVAAVVEILRDALAPLCDRPYALFGHSLGALVAYELARALRDQGSPLPVHFFASGSRAPHAPLPERPLHVLRGEALLERLRELGGTPAEVLANRELVELFTPLLLADLEMSETYRTSAPDPLDVPVTALGGREDAEVRVEKLTAWSRETSRGFDRRLFPGGHFFLNVERAEVLRVVGEKLSPHLA